MSVFNSDLSSASGFLIHHPVSQHVLYVTAGHIRTNEPVNLAFDKITYKDGAKNTLRSVSPKRIILHFPKNQGDITIYDIDDIYSGGGKILKPNSKSGKRNPNTYALGFNGIFNDLLIRPCKFVKIHKDFGNGIQLSEFNCQESSGLQRRQFKESDEKPIASAKGTSGGPVIEQHDINSVIGLISGGFIDKASGKVDQSRVVVTVFDIEQLLSQ